MRFFYQLERFEFGEYVIVKVEEEGFNGIGAIVPEKSEGENYKIIMGAIEEYRHVVENARSYHFATISQKLQKVFPGHPKVRFAISAAVLELYSNLAKTSVEDILMCGDFPSAVQFEDWKGEVVDPEKLGGVFEVLSISSKDEKALAVRKYPKGEMAEVLKALSKYFRGYVLK